MKEEGSTMSESLNGSNHAAPRRLHRWLLVPAALALAILSLPARSEITFSLDDGTGETAWGINCPGPLDTVSWAWLNRFSNYLDQSISITVIQGAFGSAADNVQPGHAIDGVIYVDPTGSGHQDSIDLAAWWSISGGIPAPTGALHSFAVPTTVIVPPGGDAYVGFIDVQSLADQSFRRMALQDTSSSALRSFSLRSAEPCPVATLDPTDPAELIAYGPAVWLGNWMVRAKAQIAGDFNDDGAVNAADLGAVLSQWGACKSECAADLTADGVVNAADLALMLANWG
jgi:hypothetical protein